MNVTIRIRCELYSTQCFNVLLKTNHYTNWGEGTPSCLRQTRPVVGITCKCRLVSCLFTEAKKLSNSVFTTSDVFFDESVFSPWIPSMLDTKWFNLCLAGVPRLRADPSTWKFPPIQGFFRTLRKTSHPGSDPSSLTYVSLAPLKNPRFWRSMIRKLTSDLPKPFQTDLPDVRWWRVPLEMEVAPVGWF